MFTFLTAKENYNYQNNEFFICKLMYVYLKKKFECQLFWALNEKTIMSTIVFKKHDNDSQNQRNEYRNSISSIMFAWIRKKIISKRNPFIICQQIITLFLLI